VPLDEFRRSFTGVAVLLEPGEDFTPGKKASGLGRYLRQILGDAHVWTRILVTSLLIELFALATPLLTSAIVDRVVPRADTHLLVVLGAGMVALLVFTALASLIRAHLLLHLRTYLDARMTLGFLGHLIDLPYDFFQRRPAGDLMMRLSSNTTIREILTSTALSGAIDGVFVTGYLVILFVGNVWIALLTLFFAAAQIAGWLATRRRQQDLNAMSLAREAR
jgi:ABC-type bacteriocin/lantibiotic exporter with double-glycine peptidase domain